MSDPSAAPAAPPAAVAARPFAQDDRWLLGHPRGLGLIFVVEMWERFSYYGMRAILVLYLVNALRWDTAHAAGLYGTYTMAVYLTPLVGGYLADRWIGTRRSLVLGGAIIAAGHFALAFHGMSMFYVGLTLIVIGTGFFKPNASTMVGQMYRAGDARRDSGFTIFYMGINVGAFLGVPLRLDGAPIGMIGLANRAGPYEDEHERLTLTYASLIAVLVHNAQLYEQLQRTNEWLERLVDERTSELAQARDALAEKASRLQAVLADTVDTQENERRRIAADVHDGINQLLIGAMLELTSSRHRIGAGQAEAAVASLDSARDRIDFWLALRGRELIGKTVAVAGEHLSGTEMAAELTRALGQEVRYQNVPPEVYRSFGFPGADDLGNMFQYKRDFNREYREVRDVEAARRLNPELQTFAAWLSRHAKEIPVD